MNTADFTYLLNKPEAINEKQTMALEAVLLKYPFMQSARALHLKGLYNQDSFRYNYELKKTAAHSTDRTILFDFITSEQFVTLQKNTIEVQEENINNITVNESLTLAEVNIEENEINFSEETHQIENTTSIEEELEIGKPLNFNQAEKHSFQEWLQLTQLKPIDRPQEEDSEPIDEEKIKKLELIDKFIEANPKIPATKEAVKTPVNVSKSIEEPTHLMTETLAKVFLEQKKYQRAIQAYEILILKYPEKSSFFADRINSIKKLQQNNNN